MAPQLPQRLPISIGERHGSRPFCGYSARRGDDAGTDRVGLSRLTDASLPGSVRLTQIKIARREADHVLQPPYVKDDDLPLMEGHEIFLA
ncbi:hypothetical protein [Sphingomonas natans]|uniref:hypothetical protein n=1 Tax=Sphingomonas natans TaxID=3063330 RepID=UPI0026E311C2|nr:hypothetical protein [Sphingomonas sp. BIUV-7]